MFFIAEMVREFGLHGAFKNRFGELFKQSIFPENVFRRVVIFQKLINEIEVNFIGHRVSFAVGVFTLLLYDRLHKASYTLEGSVCRCAAKRPEKSF
jgi:hypothetical protein